MFESCYSKDIVKKQEKMLLNPWAMGKGEGIFIFQTINDPHGRHRLNFGWFTDRSFHSIDRLWIYEFSFWLLHIFPWSFMIHQKSLNISLEDISMVLKESDSWCRCYEFCIKRFPARGLLLVKVKFGYVDVELHKLYLINVGLHFFFFSFFFYKENLEISL